jgi:hypothetical protein
MAKKKKLQNSSRALLNSYTLQQSPFWLWLSLKGSSLGSTVDQIFFKKVGLTYPSVELNM